MAQRSRGHDAEAETCCEKTGKFCGEVGSLGNVGLSLVLSVHAPFDNEPFLASNISTIHSAHL